MNETTTDSENSIIVINIFEPLLFAKMVFIYMTIIIIVQLQ